MALDTIPKQEGGKLKAIASGTLPSGQPAVVNADGTVSVVVSSGSAAELGSAAAWSGYADELAAAYDANTSTIVIAFEDSTNSNYGTAIVGTVSGTSISFGSAVVFKSARAAHIDVTYDSNSQKVVIVFRDYGNSNYGTAIVGTVSGTSISFGSTYTYNSGTSNENHATFDSNSNKVVIAYKDWGNSGYGTAVVGNVSGTSISFGSEVVFESASVFPWDIVYDSSAQKVVITYRDDSNGTKGTSIVGTVSGTSISFGTKVAFTASAAYQLGSAYDSNASKIVISFKDQANSDYGAAIVGTVSGTSISFGTQVLFSSSVVGGTRVVYDQAAQKVVIVYHDNGNSSYGTLVEGTVSGNSISFSDPLVFNEAASYYLDAVYDSNQQKVAIVYNGVTGASKVYQTGTLSTNLTSENYIGMSSGVVNATETLTEAIGTPVTYYTTAATAYTAATFDSNSNKFVVSFRGQGDDGTSVVGTVNSSNNSISFGSPAIWNTNESLYINTTFDSSSNKVVVVYRDEGNSSHGTAVVGTVSGTSISFGTPVVFEAAAIDFCDVTFDSSNNKVVIAYRDRGNSFYGTSIVGTVSGTSISFGSPVVFNSNSTIYNSITFDSNSNKAVVFYFNLGSATNGTGIVGTVSGTSISFGTPAQFESGNIDMVSSTFDSNSNKTVVAYRDESNSNYGTATVGTVSGTNISFGTPVVFEAAGVDSTATTFDSNANKVNIFYEDAGNSAYGTVIVGTVSGTSISFGSPVVFQTSTTGQFAAAFDSNSNRAVGAYANEGSSSHGTAVVVRNAGDYLVSAQVADGAAATVDIVGTVSTNQVGLTAGQQYYVQTDGTVGTTPADPSVLAGTAISATKMIVKT